MSAKTCLCTIPLPKSVVFRIPLFPLHRNPVRIQQALHLVPLLQLLLRQLFGLIILRILNLISRCGSWVYFSAPRKISMEPMCYLWATPCGSSSCLKLWRNDKFSLSCWKNTPQRTKSRWMAPPEKQCRWTKEGGKSRRRKTHWTGCFCFSCVGLC